MLDLLCRLNREEGATMVLVTHEQPLAAGMGRIVTLRDGRIAAS